MTEITEGERMQDFWSQLIEECRIGTVYRPIIRPDRTTFEMHKPQIDLSDVPVFYWDEMPFERDDAELGEALKAAQTVMIKLPYPRVAFLYKILSDNPVLYQGPVHLRNYRERVYAVVAEEEDDGSLSCFSFFRHYRKMDHWVKQAWQGRVTSGQDSPAELYFAYDPGISAAADFIEMYSRSNQDRILSFLVDLHRLMTRTGSTSFASVGKETARINLRRNRLKLPDVPAVRIIRLGDPLPHAAPSVPSSLGTAKRPHFRHGTYRTLATGRRIWVRPSAIHGGGTDAPPWYEVR